MLDPHVCIAELMRTPVICVSDRSLVRTVVALSEENNVHFFAVQRQCKLVGRICKCDLRNSHPDTPLGELMQPLLLTLSSDTSLEESQIAMQPGMDWTIVRDKTSLVGVVTWHDVLQAMPTERAEHDGYRCSGCGIDHRLQVAQSNLLLCPECRLGDRFEMGVAG